MRKQKQKLYKRLGRKIAMDKLWEYYDSLVIAHFEELYGDDFELLLTDSQPISEELFASATAVLAQVSNG